AVVSQGTRVAAPAICSNRGGGPSGLAGGHCSVESGRGEFGDRGARGTIPATQRSRWSLCRGIPKVLLVSAFSRRPETGALPPARQRGRRSHGERSSVAHGGACSNLSGRS